MICTCEYEDFLRILLVSYDFCIQTWTLTNETLFDLISDKLLNLSLVHCGLEDLELISQLIALSVLIIQLRANLNKLFI